MADLDRPERITNITGLRAQLENPEGHASSSGRRRWPLVDCRLCGRHAWLFASTCACGMTNPARDARQPYMLPALIVVLLLLAGLVAWWYPSA